MKEREKTNKELYEIINRVKNKQEQELKKKEERLKKQELPIQSSSQQVNNVIRCNDCKVVFNSKAKMERHYRRDHQKLTVYKFECCNCTAEFTRLSSYHHHRRVQHPPPSPNFGYRRTVDDDDYDPRQPYS
mgnify:CR=1 FL=1